MESRKCASCGAFGVGVVQLNGLCGHCTRQRQAATSAPGPRVGEKRRREEGPAAEPPSSSEDIARLLAEAEKVEVPNLDATGVKKLLLSLEKKITRNALARAKHTMEPARFMESEVELDDELKRARLLAAAPEHYPLLLSSSSSSSASSGAGDGGGTGALKSLLGLLSHENVDIAIDVLQLLEEMTDSDVLVDSSSDDNNDINNDGDEEEEESSDDEEKRHDVAAQRRRQARKDRRQARHAKRRGLYLLLKALVDEGALELLVATLLRLEASSSSEGEGEGKEEEEEESQGIYSCLGLISNLVDSDATLSSSTSSAGGVAIGRLDLAARLVRITATKLPTSSLSSSLPLEPALPRGYGSSAATSSSLLGFLLRKVRARPQQQQQLQQADFDSNKGASAELLSILLSADVDRNAAALGEGKFASYSSSASTASKAGAGSVTTVEGMEALLEAVNVYKKRSPASREEEECVENLFDCCCTALMLPSNQARFRAIEGFELLVRVISLAGFSRYGALKVLSYAVADSPINCAALVDCGGLKEVFPAFMGKGLQHTKRLHGGDSSKDELEHSVCIVSSCASLLPLPGQELRERAVSTAGGDADYYQDGAGSKPAPAAVAGLQLLRFLAKFTESHHEKIDRLVELRRLFAAKVHRATLRRLEEEKEEGLDSEDEDDDGDDEDATKARAARRELREELRYSSRMDAGLFTLQRLDLVLARLVTVALEASSASASASANDKYLPLLNDVGFNARKKLYEAAGNTTVVAASSSNSSGAAEEDADLGYDAETAAVLRSGLPASLSLSLTGVGEVLLEQATRLEREEEEAAATSAGGKPSDGGRTSIAASAASAGGVTASLRALRSSMLLAQLRPLIERLTEAAGWTSSGADGESTAASTAPATTEGAKA